MNPDLVMLLDEHFRTSPEADLTTFPSWLSQLVPSAEPWSDVRLLVPVPVLSELLKGSSWAARNPKTSWQLFGVLIVKEVTEDPESERLHVHYHLASQPASLAHMELGNLVTNMRLLTLAEPS